MPVPSAKPPFQAFFRPPPHFKPLFRFDAGQNRPLFCLHTRQNTPLKYHTSLRRATPFFATQPFSPLVELPFSIAIPPPRAFPGRCGFQPRRSPRPLRSPTSKTAKRSRSYRMNRSSRGCMAAKPCSRPSRHHRPPRQRPRPFPNRPRVEIGATARLSACRLLPPPGYGLSAVAGPTPHTKGIMVSGLTTPNVASG